MSSAAPPTAVSYRWHHGELRPLDRRDVTETRIAAADSWLVSDGRVRGLELHRARFSGAVPEGLAGELGLDSFWAAVVDRIPRQGDWFPRVELQLSDGSPLLAFRERSAPTRSRSVVLATHDGPDPRTRPTIKGPDLDAMSGLRVAAQRRGAGEAIILSPDGFVVEGAYSALLWWRGDTLCAPSAALERVDSVTAKTVLTLAGALGVDVVEESVTPGELEGFEVWAVSALHGIRVVTAWVDGPQMAEEPGRAELWRRRLDRLSRPLGELPGPLDTLEE